MTGRYRAYPEYKDSGVEWLGEVPAQWGTFPEGAFIMGGKWMCGKQQMDQYRMDMCRMGKALRAHQLHSIPQRWARFALPILRGTIANGAEVYPS